MNSSAGASMTNASLRAINQEAVRLLREQDPAGALAKLDLLLSHVADKRVALPDVYTCFSNRSAVHLALGNPTAALTDAISGLRCIEQQLAGVPLRRHPAYAGVMRRLGDALMATGRLLLAQDAYDESLMSDPSQPGARAGLQAVLQQLRNTVTQAPATPSCADTASPKLTPSQAHVPASALQPCHSLSDNDFSITPGSAAAQQLVLQLPQVPLLQQLTPQQTEVDVVTRDTLNFLTIQSDIRVPKELVCSYLQDAARMQALAAAVQAAVKHITENQGHECRVMCLGGGMGVLPILALKAGATHVTVVERWMYAALAAKELLQYHDISPEHVTVLHGKVTDMRVCAAQVPVCVNLVIAEPLLDSGLLTSGLCACVRHVMSHMATPEAIIIPTQLDVWCQVVEMKTPCVSGITLDALDMYQGDPLPEGLSRHRGQQPSCSPLSPAAHIWSFSCRHMPAAPQARSLHIQASASGHANAVKCWYTATLFHDIHWTTADHDHHNLQPGSPPESTITSLRPVEHPLHVCTHLQPQQTLHLVAAHNTAKLGFSCNPADDVLAPAASQMCTASDTRSKQLEATPHPPADTAASPAGLVTPSRMLMSEDVSLPRSHFHVGADTAQLAAYQTTIQRCVQSFSNQGVVVHTLDLKSGPGAVGILAARAGSESVTCIEEHPTLARIARLNAALNGVSNQVCVVQGTPKEASDCMRQHLPRGGCNLITLGCTTPDLLGCGVVSCLVDAVRHGLVSQSAAVVPAKVVMFCMGVEVLVRRPAGAAPLTVLVQGDEEPGINSSPAAQHSHQDHENSQQVSEAKQLLVQVDLAVLNKYRWTEEPEAVNLDALPHVRLTPPFALWEMDLASLVPGSGEPFKQATPANQPAMFQPTATSEAHPPADPNSYFVKQGGGGGLMLQSSAIAAGVLNAIAVWYDVHLDQDHVITTAPSGIGPGGMVLCGNGHSTDGAGIQQDGVTRVDMPAQLLQYTQHVQAVSPGQIVQLVAQRQPGGVVVNVRPSKGVLAPKPPWKEEWGGGSSVENPHVQRVKYCELLEADLMQRLPCGRGPSVEQDVRELAEHCGSLLLHPPTVRAVLRHLSLLERLYCPSSPSRPPGSARLTSDRWEVAVLATGAGQHSSCRPDVRVNLSPELVPAVNWRHMPH